MKILFDDINYKKRNSVFSDDEYIFYELPCSEEFIRQEGILMEHCLEYANNDYCRRMIAGEIKVFSMTNKHTNMPVVDIEVAFTKSSYGGPVSKPTVSQIRGIRNECPPKDDYIPSLIKFFESYGRDWIVQTDIKNFDGQTDGIILYKRWNELCS